MRAKNRMFDIADVVCVSRYYSDSTRTVQSSCVCAHTRTYTRSHGRSIDRDQTADLLNNGGIGHRG